MVNGRFKSDLQRKAVMSKLKSGQGSVHKNDPMITNSVYKVGDTVKIPNSDEVGRIESIKGNAIKIRMSPTETVIVNAKFLMKRF